MDSVALRPASISDLDTLRRWDEQPHVIAADPNDDWNWETELARRPTWREHLVAMLDERPIGFVQIIDPAAEESNYWETDEPGLRAVDIWIGEPDCLGRGFGTEIMRQVIARCFSDSDVHTILLDPLASNTDAHRFYRRLGFAAQERRCFGEDDCLVFRLKREAWNALHS